LSSCNLATPLTPYADTDASALERDFGFMPKITLREGLRKFAEWSKSSIAKQLTKVTKGI
jgi:nucleoside-diphosphate-sugar epimerase